MELTCPKVVNCTEIVKKKTFWCAAGAHGRSPRRLLEPLAQSDGESEAIRTVYDTLKAFADASRLLTRLSALRANAISLLNKKLSYRYRLLEDFGMSCTNCFES